MEYYTEIEEEGEAEMEEEVDETQTELPVNPIIEKGSDNVDTLTNNSTVVP